MPKTLLKHHLANHTLEISTLTGDICLEYQYTKLGRWTYFGRWTLFPWVIKIRCLEYDYIKLGRWTYFGWWTPTQWIKHRCLEYCYTKHGRQTYFGQWTLRSASRSIPQIHHGIYIMGCIWQPFCILQEKVRISCYFWKIRVVNSQLAWYSHVRCKPLDTPNTPETPQNNPTWQLQISTMRTHICQCEGTAWRYTMVNGCRMDGWMLFLMILCFVPRQLRFSLCSGGVFTRTWFSL